MTTPAVKTEKQLLEAENARLRARIKELEHPARDLPFHAFDTAKRLARGFTYMVVEELQCSVDAIHTVADKIFKADYEGRTNVLSNLTSGLAEGAHKVLEMPRRASDCFSDAFHAEPNGRGTRTKPTEMEEGSELETEAAE